QVFEWLQKGATFSEMKNIPNSLKEKLAGEHIDQSVSIRESVHSGIDDTVKFLYELKDGNCIEGVLMHYHYGYSLCVSTQVGCRMGCAFCASTLDGKVRNLTAAEILGQVIAAQKTLNGERIGHIVLMGSGEPFDNYDEVVRFIRLVSDENGLNISVRHISLSTCGLVPEMYRFADEGLPVTLSLSLHAPNDEIRKKLMPVAKRYSISETLEACRNYIQKTGRRVIFEYALIRNVNSDRECARELAGRLRGMQCHVNLIPLNTVKERNLIGVNEKEVNDFLNELKNANVSATRRREMGDDIEGACGQLRKSRLEQDERTNKDDL
ncbi:MAG: 23S rRNA (adenine(2503)-C(2))-methyltransferase RlmN, partial [Clostridiales bacterium]|nr:23S rRNA (adenine(2503)-C(2))-methyltransferase RlmN [Clostridiales bacterium]